MGLLFCVVVYGVETVVGGMGRAELFEQAALHPTGNAAQGAGLGIPEGGLDVGAGEQALF